MGEANEGSKNPPPDGPRTTDVTSEVPPANDFNRPDGKQKNKGRRKTLIILIAVACALLLVLGLGITAVAKVRLANDRASSQCKVKAIGMGAKQSRFE